MTKNYIALAIPGFFTFILAEYLVARWQKKQYYRFNDAVTDLSCGLGQQLIGIFLKSFLFGIYVYVYTNFAVFHFSSELIAWTVAFIGVDFCYYWWHRMSHQVNFMWALHVVHHQSEEYNFAVALRQAWFTGFTSIVFYLPLAFIGVTPGKFATMAAVSTLYQFWIHTRTVGKLGFLEWVINTPALHRVHHARNREYLDKNHGATLIVWDIIFGTYCQEQQEPLYGTVKPYGSWNPIWANFHYWRDLIEQTRHTKRFIDKIKLWFMYPGWSAEPTDAVERKDSTEIETPRIRYDTRLPIGLNLYIALHYIPTLLISTIVLFYSAAMSQFELLLTVLMMLLTVLIVGGIFEKRFWAFALEVFRLCLFSIVSVWVNLHYSTVFDRYYLFTTVLFLVISAAWFTSYRKLFGISTAVLREKKC